MASRSLWRGITSVGIFVGSIALLLGVVVAAPLSSRSSAAPPDDIQSSAFFSQTGGYYVRDGLDALGRPQNFFSAFRNLGGVDTLGYPVSRPFTGSGGFTYQAFQRGVLQWRPELGRAVLANTFEWLQQGGRDAWLSNLGVPPPVLDDGSNGDWNRARETRLAWLTDPAIKLKYSTNPSSGHPWAVDEAIQLYGLPMSRPEKRGPFVVQRFQRIAFQFWVENVAGMPPSGSVVGVLGGDLLKQSGVMPAQAVATDAINGLYLSYHAVGREHYRQRILDLAATTEINAVVVDVKNEFGYTTYSSAVPLAKEIGASSKPTVANFPALVASFRGRGLYVIARIPVFKDDLLARSKTSLAIRDARTGSPWRDAKGLAWTDPYQSEVWDYNIALAKEAARQGVDEIQFDYIRFPAISITDGQFAQTDKPADRTDAINGFLARARSQLQPTGVKLAADLFGYTIWRKEELGVGQRFDDMARYLDVVSPMLYPSSFSTGIPGYRPGIAYPYEVVLRSVQEASKRLAGKPVQVRPWLQDFGHYTGDGRPLTVEEVVAQIRGAKEAGAAGWMLWNPNIAYTREALAPE